MSIYPRVVAPEHTPPDWWIVVLPYGKGFVPFDTCPFVRIDKSWASQEEQWWHIEIAAIDRSWMKSDPEWWVADFNAARRIPYPQ